MALVVSSGLGKSALTFAKPNYSSPTKAVKPWSGYKKVGQATGTLQACTTTKIISAGAAERAKELAAKASETTKDAYEKAVKQVGHALEKAQQEAAKAYEKAKEVTSQAINSTKKATQQQR